MRSASPSRPRGVLDGGRAPRDLIPGPATMRRAVKERAPGLIRAPALTDPSALRRGALASSRRGGLAAQDLCGEVDERERGRLPDRQAEATLAQERHAIAR